MHGVLIRLLDTGHMNRLRMMDSIAENLMVIQQRVKGLAKNSKEPLLVAVSKTKPVEAILEAYQAGQRHFGENYAKEIASKAKDPRILSSCPDIRWHFIGHLQRKAVNKVVGVQNLFVIETVDSPKIAEALNEGWKKKKTAEKLKVMLELNTSGEDSKHGFKADEVVEAAKFLKENCDQLRLTGLMTIGSATNSLQNVKPNPDFLTLIDCRKRVSEALGFNPDELELSMGMSHDYEHAVEMGSTEVRVGTAVFGNRPYPPNSDVGDSEVNQRDSPGSSGEETAKRFAHH
ncbi:hypothetical protein RvY_04541 [Ramazzottius varieornatus]|uniref:Pyridoxal phosphate homeostasis protein n=1 Tax=Ramazzottius varieornatus TaxID=947166 RepID=A0A1D1US08_RAMVA|nr:hypothetical protein RvY_04541 [Ramazzottius varieornatus]